MTDRIKITYAYCLDYIASKNDRLSLTLEDLLYLSNFKGGGGTIQESKITLGAKLKYFSDVLRGMETLFGNKNLYSLSESEIQNFIEICNTTLEDCLSGSTHKIAGIGPSYMSALLHLYFGRLCPIIDRNILIGLDLVDRTMINSQGQVRDIHIHYGTLVQKIYLLQKADPSKSIKDLDDIYFKIGQEKWRGIQRGG